MEIDTDVGMSDAAMTADGHYAAQHRVGTLQNLPSELLFPIFADAVLARRDLKALRLTCRRFPPFVVQRLFGTVGISKAWRDRQAFFNIASNLELAKHVRRLVWYEMRGTFANLNVFYDGVVWDGPDNLAPGPEPPECRMEQGNPPTVSWPTLSPDENAWRTKFVSEAMALFWWPIAATMTAWDLKSIRKEDPWKEDHIGPLDEFCPPFYEAILTMAGVTTFFSEQMPPSRKLQITDGGYPFTAGLFHDTASHVDHYDGNDCQEVLIPAIEQLELEGLISPRILELHMDEDCIDLSRRLNHHLRPDNERISLHGLTRLHICWVRANPLFRLIDEIPLILEAAPNLTHLRLCLDLVGSNVGLYVRSSFEGVYLRGLDPNPDFFGCLNSFPQMPKLSSLYLDGVPFTSEGMCTFLESHAETLRHLHVNTPPNLEAPSIAWEAGFMIVDDRNIPMNLEIFDLEIGGGCRTHRSDQGCQSISDSGAPFWTTPSETVASWKTISTSSTRMTALHWREWQPETPWFPRMATSGRCSEAGDIREPTSDDLVEAEINARDDIPLTRSFFSRWGDGDRGCVRINHYWKEAIAGEPIVIEGTLQQHH
ncbi:hypothetical protein CMUS01_02520 [Colletotrichum musicola]|uniref:F-box domain-containing protein n=1 Tax=Colletotrichum musicola TaxID=2175873 RepID=A0A8H6NV76_9PEZI|nr:hypothetical protein CMUS01_02520 [Colletotrichum musicola]